MDSQFINFICFNVAGNRFTTTKETILREPASRLALIARGVLPVNRDDTGAIFLDRDAKHFQLVLNYLRDGWCSLPKSQDERRELLQEIRYYQVNQLLWSPEVPPAGNLPSQDQCSCLMHLQAY